MPSVAVKLECENGHLLYLACYRNPHTIKRIKELLYCPDCDEFYVAKSEKIMVINFGASVDAQVVLTTPIANALLTGVLVQFRKVTNDWNVTGILRTK